MSTNKPWQQSCNVDPDTRYGEDNKNLSDCRERFDFHVKPPLPWPRTEEQEKQTLKQIQRLIEETNCDPKTVVMECIWLYGLMSLGFDVIGLFV